MRMRFLLKIGVLLLFMIGLFTVQLDFKPILVDDDVGMEYTDNLNSFNGNAILIVTIKNPGQVASPLKYPCYSYETITTKVETEVCITTSTSYDVYSNCYYYMAIQDQINIPEKMLTNDNESKSDRIPANIIEGLFRLDIGESS